MVRGASVESVAGPGFSVPFESAGSAESAMGPAGEGVLEAEPVFLEASDEHERMEHEPACVVVVTVLRSRPKVGRCSGGSSP